MYQNNLVVRCASCVVRKKQSSKYKAQSAFTLVELLIVLAMISIIGLAIFTTLSNGIRIWQRLNLTVAQEDINIFFERIARELRNTFEFSTIKFQGDCDRIAFATFVVTPGSSQPQGTDIGQVSYYYDKMNRQLVKENRNYSQLYKGDTGIRQELLKDIDYLRFSYYFYDEQAREYLWLETWQEDYLPLAVRIELEFDNEQQPNRIIRSINLPLAQSWRQG
jgi:prepilin-type N-terminal cleavage/methylation domain-containing protein